MSEETPKKKGLIALIRASLTRTGGCCCGPGETCGGPARPVETAPEKDVKDAEKSAKK